MEATELDNDHIEMSFTEFGSKRGEVNPLPPGEVNMANKRGVDIAKSFCNYPKLVCKQSEHVTCTSMGINVEHDGA